MITREELDNELESVKNANLSNAIRRIIVEDMLCSLDCSETGKGIIVSTPHLDVYNIDDMVDELEDYLEETISNFISDKYEIVKGKEPEL